MEKKTECQCDLAGFCKRHNVQKSAHMHKLCQNHTGYFNMWEQCKGPGQNPNGCEVVKQPLEEKEPVKEEVVDVGRGPSFLQKATNFIKAGATQLAAGNPQASEETIKARLDICAECPFFKKEEFRCGHCGCPLGAKTRWATSKCPINRWQ